MVGVCSMCRLRVRYGSRQASIPKRSSGVTLAKADISATETGARTVRIAGQRRAGLWCCWITCV